jgi:S-adenosylmethionine decarboxylase
MNTATATASDIYSQHEGEGAAPQALALTGFEGPEKRLEIDFKRQSGNSYGLREINSERWQEMLNFAKCTIISSTPNEYFDSYVLSESSLFVYPYKIMIKTCGTTTLLNCIPKLLEYAEQLGMEVEFVMFSRKNYLFPHKQIGFHSQWTSEVTYLDSIFEGSSYVIGPQSSDHWHLYLADYSDQSRIISPEKTMEIMMHKLDPMVASNFYRKDGSGDKDKFPGIADLLPGSETDEFNFSPCGYSMNGLNNENYWTIHVTPESHCSYASFETNLPLSSYTKLIKHVLSVFKPGTFTVTFFSEQATATASSGLETAFDDNIDGYHMKHKTYSQLEGNCDIMMINYESTDYADRPKPVKKVKIPAVQHLGPPYQPHYLIEV